MGPARKVLGAVSAAAIGVGLVLVCAVSTERPAAAWPPTGADGAGPSPFVTQARRGQVAAPALEAVEHMCALLTTCDRLPIPAALFPADFQACVKKMADEMSSPTAINFSLTMRECGLQADSCSSLRACAMHGANPEACKGRGRQGVVGFCDVDGRAMTCWHDSVLAVRDCNRGGEQCIVADGVATCTLGSCPPTVKEGDRPLCSASSTHLLHCESGKLASLDCATFGLKCTTAADGTAGCATSGPVCNGGAKHCDGNVALACFNGHEVRVDCDTAGLACVPSAGGIPIGVCVAPPAAAGDACDPNEKARCDGGTIHYCFAGRQRSYSCKTLGFRKCDAGKSGARCAG